jgi:LPXTG-motif cell wall-anchored protein
MTGDVLNSAAGTIGLGGSLAAGWSAEGVSMLGKVWVDGEVVAVDGPVECNPDLGEVTAAFTVECVDSAPAVRVAVTNTTADSKSVDVEVHGDALNYSDIYVVGPFASHSHTYPVDGDSAFAVADLGLVSIGSLFDSDITDACDFDPSDIPAPGGGDQPSGEESGTQEPGVGEDMPHTGAALTATMSAIATLLIAGGWVMVRRSRREELVADA